MTPDDAELENLFTEATDKHFIPKEYIDILRAKKALSGERGRLTIENIVAFATGYYNIDFSKADSLKFWILKLLYDDDLILRRKLHKVQGAKKKMKAVARHFVDAVVDNMAQDKRFMETFKAVYKANVCKSDGITRKEHNLRHRRKRIFVYDLEGKYVQSYPTKTELLNWLGESKKSMARLNKCIKTNYPFSGYIITEEER